MPLRRFLIVSASLSLLVTGCWRQPQIVLPQGLQTVSGLLETAPLSLTRRGTHVVKKDGASLYFLESSGLNLRAYEGKEVTLEGLLEANTDQEALPVLVVSRVTLTTAEEMRKWMVPDLQMEVSVPKNWKGQISGDTARFREEGATGSRMQVFIRELSALPFDFKTLQLRPSADDTLTLEPMLISGKRAARIVNGVDGTMQIFIEHTLRRPNVRTIAVVLSFEASVPELQEQYGLLANDIVESVHFLGESDRPITQSGSTSVSGNPGTGSGGTMEKPCGGPAGFLCPTGYYCEVTDRETDIGQCRRLQR